MNHPLLPAGAFGALQTSLIRRRIRSVDLILRLELAALALLSVGFVFWQVRVPLDGMVRSDGPAVYLIVSLAAWLFLAIAGGTMAGARLAAALRRGPEGPPWLALPIDAAPLQRHLVWNSTGSALPLFVPALGMLLAGIGLVPWFWIPVSALACSALLVLGTRTGCTLAVRWSVRNARGPRTMPGIVRLLSTRERKTARATLPRARWRAGGPWRAMLQKDLLVTRRPTPARSRLAAPLLFAVASALAWALPFELPLARFAAFGFALAAAASVAEWLIALSGADPFNVVRVLPVGLREVWGVRAALAAAAALALVLAHVVAAPPMSPLGTRLFVTWMGLATLCIGVLGANYGVTLFPRSDQAARLLALSLGLAMAASLMIPLLGWVLLLTAVIHSARRLPRWSRLENA